VALALWISPVSASAGSPTADSGVALVWVDAAGVPTQEAVVALAMLTDAAAEGLEPNDYQVAQLVPNAARLASSPGLDAVAQREFDRALTAATASYLHDLHSGRVDPRTQGFDMPLAPDDHDFSVIVREAAAARRVRETASEYAPALPLYRALRSALAEYRRIAADTSLAELPPLKTTLHRGDSYVGMTALRRLLVALGDWPPDATPAVGDTFDPSSVQAVARFQVRHGLVADGVVGKATEAALRISPAARVRQLEFAMERLRWLPHLGDERFVAVNIPMFRLWAWDSIPPDGMPSFDTAVIVGRALRTRTPVFVEEMHHVIFRPYWNVPPSILRGEILPALRRDPDYLRRQNMEVVAGPGDDARSVRLTPEVLEQLGRGTLRVRQRPGPGNSLGLVKFVFPNDENVYMHGTPAPQLFERARRDFSHGCVRVQDPVALAEWVLKDRPDWTRDRILSAMHGSESIRVDLPRPIRVVLFYITAVVMPEDGAVHFAEDIYGHDTRLARALPERTRR
jgi:murein L,D-transpeptidase YcbB/YkuD